MRRTRTQEVGACPLGACPTLTVLPRRTIRDHLRRARPEKNPQRIPANTPPVFPGLRPRIWQHFLRLVTKAMSDRLLVSSPPT